MPLELTQASIDLFRIIFTSRFVLILKRNCLQHLEIFKEIIQKRTNKKPAGFRITEDKRNICLFRIGRNNGKPIRIERSSRKMQQETARNYQDYEKNISHRKKLQKTTKKKQKEKRTTQKAVETVRYGKMFTTEGNNLN